MAYFTVVTPSLTAGLASDYKFNLNGLFDPDLTGTGHQPYGYDQISTFYARWVVTRCRYQIRLTSSAGSITVLTAVPDNSATSFGTGDRDLAAESPMAQTIISASASPTDAQVITGDVILPRLTGRTKAEYLAGARYNGATAANPSETLVLHIVTQCDSTTATAVDYTVKLEYDAEFYDPTNLVQS
jgi:hypothetical protein